MGVLLNFSAFVGMALANSTASYDCILTSLPQRIWTIITETGLQTEFALRGRGGEKCPEAPALKKNPRGCQLEVILDIDLSGFQ